jgi:two-component system response regulator (stage 0 sporulation protein F)
MEREHLFNLGIPSWHGQTGVFLAMATILIIDDEEIIRVLLRSALEAAGYEVTEATNGRQGLELYRHRPTDLVITDILMLELNGLEMLLALTREFIHAKVIAISGIRWGRECLGCRETPRGTADLPEALKHAAVA